ncbi:hypothetical protein [Halomonas elongata]|nr:hypothetical protein [Halomonas elongata]
MQRQVCGLWRTVAAFIACCLALSATAIAWRLPDIIAVLQGA